MAEPTFVFLDFDDTLSDFEEHGRQYVAELALLLAQEHGGTETEWSDAIRPALQESLHRYVERFAGNPLAGYAAWLEEERARAAASIFQRMGRPLPEGEPLADYARRVQFDALTACNAAFPGACEGLRQLFEDGVRTQIASSQDSEYLYAALLGTGSESYTENKFGPDLVDCAKEGPEFYARIFHACRIHPSQAIVVDDQAMCLDWAEEAGARVAQARMEPGSPPAEFPVVLTSLFDLPALVRRLSGREGA